MTTQSDAHERDRNEMVKQAASLTASVEKVEPVATGAATADSSGFVDIAAFSASDPEWVERALASSRGVAASRANDRAKPTPTVRGMLLAPQTLRPVALSELVPEAAPRPRSRSVVLAAALGALGAVAITWTVAREVRGVTTAATSDVADGARAAALAAVVVSATAEPAQAPPVASVAASASAAPAVSASAPAAPVKPAARAAARPASSPAVGAPSPMRAKVPPPKPASGQPSLEEMMRRAAQPPAKPKK